MVNFIQGFGIVVGVTAGVVAGTFVTVVIKHIEKRMFEKQRRKNLKFEFEFNIKKIVSFRAELNNYLNAVTRDALGTYFGYLELSKIIYPTAQSMFADGSLYKFFDKNEDLVDLQESLSHYTVDLQDDFSRKIKENTEISKTDKWQTTKPDTVAYIRYIDERFQDDIVTMKNFVEKL